MAGYQETGRSVMEIGCPPVIRQAIRRQLAAVYAQEAQVYGVVIDPETVMADAPAPGDLSPEIVEMVASAGNGETAPASMAASATAPAPPASAPAPAAPAPAMTDDGKDPKRVAAGLQAWKTREANANKKGGTASRATTQRAAKKNAVDDRPRGRKAFDTKVRKYMEAHPGVSERDAGTAVMQHTAVARSRKALERNNPKSSQTRTPSRSTGRRSAAPAQQQEAARA